jgi:hypothetical protein
MWSLAAAARYVYSAPGNSTVQPPSVQPIGRPFTPVSSRSKRPPRPEPRSRRRTTAGGPGYFGVNFAPNDKLNAALTFITPAPTSSTRWMSKATRSCPTALLSIALGFPGRLTHSGSTSRASSASASPTSSCPSLRWTSTTSFTSKKAPPFDTYEGEGNSWDLGHHRRIHILAQVEGQRIGYMYTEHQAPGRQSADRTNRKSRNWSANSFGAGVVFSPTPKWDITFGGLYVDYKDVTDDVWTIKLKLFGVPVGYDKKIWNLSAGVTWKFF